MYRFELQDNELFEALKPFVQGLISDEILMEKIKALGNTAFSYAYGEGSITKEDFQKSLISWFEGMIKALPTVPMRSSLTRKQKRFIKAYKECDGNGAEAARRAGYSEKSARKIASLILKKPAIKERLKDFIQI